MERDTDVDDDEKALGSRNVARDLGIPSPEALIFTWRLGTYLTTAMQAVVLTLGHNVVVDVMKPDGDDGNILISGQDDRW